MQYLKNVLSIDPGDHSGWAYWKGDLFPIVGQFDVSHRKEIRILEDQLAYLWKLFSENFSLLLDKYHNTKYVFLEGVEFWEGSLKSVTAAKRQNLMKLAYLVGGYANEARSRGVEVRILPARQWKGQMSNKVLEKRVLSINGQFYESEHILNAVGIGLSRMGLLLNTRTMPSRQSKSKWRDIRWRK